jgi:hypothetical protein
MGWIGLSYLSRTFSWLVPWNKEVIWSRLSKLGHILSPTSLIFYLLTYHCVAGLFTLILCQIWWRSHQRVWWLPFVRIWLLIGSWTNTRWLTVTTIIMHLIISKPLLPRECWALSTHCWINVIDLIN